MSEYGQLLNYLRSKAVLELFEQKRPKAWAQTWQNWIYFPGTFSNESWLVDHGHASFGDSGVVQLLYDNQNRTALTFKMVAFLDSNVSVKMMDRFALDCCPDFCGTKNTIFVMLSEP